jgi:alpha-ribazole phosphatase
MQERETKIELLRHGLPVGGSRYRGKLDDALSEKGWQQMWDAVAGHAGWQQIVTSPLRRCHDFAQALGERTGLPVAVDARFAEVGFGSWEGSTKQELEAQAPGQVARFLKDPVTHRPPGAEALDDFVSRVHAGLADILRAHAGQRVLLVTHAGVIRAVMTRVLGMPPALMYRIHVANAGLTRIRTDRERIFTLVSHGSP